MEYCAMYIRLYGIILLSQPRNLCPASLVPKSAGSLVLSYWYQVQLLYSS